MDTSSLLYASDLTDAEWTLLKPLLPPESPIGRPRLPLLRTIFNSPSAAASPAWVAVDAGVRGCWPSHSCSHGNLYTGDLARVDEDGYFSSSGRISEFIKPRDDGLCGPQREHGRP
jgi:acyl-CoA synthetase (AMP-forming)/AMP-acid ligase II